MADIAQAMRYKIDVKNGLVKQPMTGVLMRGDNNANRIIAQLVDGDKTVSLDGVTVTGKFFRGGDGIEIPLEGSASGNEATVLLDEHCYAVDGYFEASIKLKTGGATRTILTITGQVVNDGDGGILDIENVIPSVADIVAQYQSMQEVTAQTEAARDAANAAAGAANTAADNAEEKARAAETAAQGASGWANAAMTADLLPAGSDPTVVITTAEDGRKIITLGIPKGDTGATPQISVEVSTGAAGSEASVSMSGTAENPVIHLTIPRGDVGNIGNLTINGKSPDRSGAVTLTAEDVSALPVEGKAADSSKLDGKTLAEIMLALYPVGAVYISTNSTSPDTLFGGRWEQIKGRFLLGTGAPENNDDGTSPGDYDKTPGSKGGEEKHALTESEMAEHYHDLSKISWGGDTSATIRNEGAYLVYDENSEEPLRSDYFGKAGGNQPHNNMPPYLAVYMWKRVN